MNLYLTEDGDVIATPDTWEDLEDGEAEIGTLGDFLRAVEGQNTWDCTDEEAWREACSWAGIDYDTFFGIEEDEDGGTYLPYDAPDAEDLCDALLEAALKEDPRAVIEYGKSYFVVGERYVDGKRYPHDYDGYPTLRAAKDVAEKNIEYRDDDSPHIPVIYRAEDTKWIGTAGLDVGHYITRAPLDYAKPISVASFTADGKIEWE